MSTDQEYDAQADMIDDHDPDDRDVDNFVPNFQMPPHGAEQQLGVQGSPSVGAPSASTPSSHGYPGAMGQTFDPFDPMLDADPFGLTASMQFPTQFTYDRSQARR